jgi:diphthine-ammonia ligase
MRAAALFSGGKDCLYATYLVEKQGVVIDDLITLLTTLPRPSPHAENIEALKVLAHSMHKNLTIIDFRKEGAFIQTLRNLEIDGLVAGDVFVEAHKQGLEDVCGKLGLKLYEPLYGRDTFELFHEIFECSFKAAVTGVNLNMMREEILGFTISKETSVTFLSRIGDKDPLGENGEFHTLVLECPLYSKQFKLQTAEKKAVKDIVYLQVSMV